MHINHPGPYLLLLEEKCKSNIKRMAAKAKAAGVKLRPHFKTHQSLAIGEWFREEGMNSITVSSMNMAAYFIFKGGWKNVTLAFPFNPNELDHLNHICSAEGVEFNICTANASLLKTLKSSLKKNIGVYLKVDIGNHRSGADPDDFDEISDLMNAASGIENLKGFLGHAGNSYKSKNKGEILSVHQNSLEIMKNLKSEFGNRFANCEISVGDTPTCSIADSFPGADEIRPGNFVFYDEMQIRIGSCERENIAVVMNCPVVDIRRKRNELIIHGGGIHFSKDYLVMENGNPFYGQVVKYEGGENYSKVNGSYLSSLSQEHGVVKFTEGNANEYKAGDMISISPVHSCLTADLMGGYLNSEGKYFDHFRTGIVNAW